ncbi:adhesion G protein-coupled receptor E3-like isoform X3 [Dermochelys coriacea]|uniref:adhesion G protein-coupled receptor E3-like isoform X3 n=1 Tax=Dermochelys coriacea TaxID=27794 RepID=UPI0018E7E2A1|nr:adhesion G protein-coupled receptor E3-like isoform X3 [Dermochelys coriacea]
MDQGETERGKDLSKVNWQAFAGSSASRGLNASSVLLTGVMIHLHALNMQCAPLLSRATTVPADLDDSCMNSSTCPDLATCQNIPGGYHCTCKDGFVPSFGAEPFTDPRVECVVDGCWNSSSCPAFAICENFSGGHHCTCKQGFSSSSEEHHFTNPTVKCVDIDECSQVPSVCGPHSICINTLGSFTCQCSPGYSSSSGTSWKPGDSHTLNCTENLFICQPGILQGDDFKSRCSNTTQHGNQKSNRFCTILNQTTKHLESACGNGNQSVSLEEVFTSLDSLFNATAQQSTESKEEVTWAATTFLQRVELAALEAAQKSPENKPQTIIAKTMTIAALRVMDNCSRAGKMIELNAQSDSMSIDCTTVVGASEPGSGAVAFISYATLESILNNNFIDQQNLIGDDKLGTITLNSKVVSGITGKPGPLSKPFNFTLKHKQRKEMEDKIVCVFWNLTGTWSTEGCRLLLVNSTHTTCNCNHLSSFAILMASHAIKESDPLTIITYVGLTLSLLCLFLAILTFLLCHSIRNVSTSLHLQLCLCLFLADLLFFTTVDRVTNKVACAVIAGLLHYLFLACFTWMFLEGLHLFLTVRNLKVVNYTSASRFKKRFMYPFGYGFPALVVAISAAVNHKGYGTSKHCWLTIEGGFIWSFLGPVCFIIVMNLAFFITTLWILRDKISSLNTDVSTLKNTRLLTFKAIAQLFILGCTWSLGLLQTKAAAMVMAYLFTIINSLQGAFIFLVHCLLNQQVREEYKRWIRRIETSRTKSQTSGLSMSAVTVTTRTEWEKSS